MLWTEHRIVTTPASTTSDMDNGILNGSESTKPSVTVHSTRQIVEHMMFIRPDLMIPFHLLGVTDSDSRSWGPTEHREQEFLWRNFVPEQLYILGLYAQLKTVMVISIPRYVPLSGPFAPMLVTIQGHQTTVDGCGLLEIMSRANQIFAQEDFLPDPFCRKIVYMKNWGAETSEMGLSHMYAEGFAFSEIYGGMWTLDPPGVLDGKSRQKCNYKTIMNNIFLDIREEVKALAVKIANERKRKR